MLLKEHSGINGEGVLNPLPHLWGNGWPKCHRDREIEDCQLKRIRNGIVLVFLSGLIFFGGKAESAISITATGDWFETIDENDLIAGAGSNLKNTYTSDGNATVLGISGCSDAGDAWKMTVKKTDTKWNAKFTFSVKRTSDGSGNGSISGGGSFILVEDNDKDFFSGAGDRSDINVQKQLGGVSLQIPPDTYSTTIVFTVTDT